jgi:hypothetical protein
MDKTNGRIQIHFHPNAPERGLFAVEKSENGAQRRYLEGVASGIMVDGHGERMTQHCIESFQRQAMTGDILLYEGLHGVNFIDDIGKLVKSDVDPSTGDWHASFRLYDAADGIGPVKQERSDDVWKQLCGFPPYSKPKQKGFSIEGDIPEGGIKVIDESGRRVMDDVILDGVVLVNRPAYRDSVAHAVYKALGIPAPWQIRKNLESTLKTKMEAAGEREEYWQKCYSLQDALDTEVRRIMGGSDSERKAQLDDVLAEYASLYSQLILEHPNMYQPTDGAMASGQSVYKTQSVQSRLLKSLESNMRLLLEVRKGNQEKNHEPRKQGQ